MSLSGRFLEAYEFTIRTHLSRRVAPDDAKFAELFPKLTTLALSSEFNARLAHDILLAKQLQETGVATEDQTFERTSEIGQRLAKQYLYGKNPELRPTEQEYQIAKDRVKRKYESEENEQS
jgi:hypothetical protein